MRSAALGHESAAADNQGISKRFACACQCPLDGGEAHDDDTFQLKKCITIGNLFYTELYFPVSLMLSGQRSESTELYYYIYKNRIYNIDRFISIAMH